MLLWLHDAPNTEEMHCLLASPEFHCCVCKFIQKNIQANINGLDEEGLKTMACEIQLAYSHPPNPDESSWEVQFKDCLCHVVQSQQVHTCTCATCLHYNKYGHLVCKHCAPWELSVSHEVNLNGSYKLRCTYIYVNNFCPPISVTVKDASPTQTHSFLPASWVGDTHEETDILPIGDQEEKR